MLRFATLIAVSLVPLTFVFGSSESDASDESDSTNNEGQEILTIFQSTMHRTAPKDSAGLSVHLVRHPEHGWQVLNTVEPAPKDSIGHPAQASATQNTDGKLSTQWSLRDYFGNMYIKCVCKCTRVKYPKEQKYSELQKRCADPENQFINAAQWYRHVGGLDYDGNWVDSFSQRDAFIACSAPIDIDYDIIRFWNMVWRNNVRVIVMLTKLVEDGDLKSLQYWPDATTVTMVHAGNIQWGLPAYSVTLTAIDIDHTGGYECSSLDVKKGHDVRAVTHCLFKEWPDMSVPNTSQFVAFRRHVKGLTAAVTDASPSPVIVHCKAGLGRTGTYIAIDVLIDCMESEPEMPVDVAGVVERLRIQRPNSILRKKQYKFCATALQAHYCTSNNHRC